MNCPKCGCEALEFGCIVSGRPFHWCPQCGSIKPCDDNPWAEPAGHAALAASHARLLAACRKMKDNEVAALTSMASDAENEAFVDGWMEMEAVIAQAHKEPT